MQFTIPAIDDLHLHLRNDERMNIATSLLASGGCCRGIIMPNIEPQGVENAQQASQYQERLKQIEPNFDYLMAIKLTPTTQAQTIIDAVKSNIIIGKQYPAGVTTNSENGVTDISAMYPIYEVMQEYKLPLSIHGEMPNTPVLDAERAFLPVIKKIAKDFPNLKIIMEHVSTREAVETIQELSDNVVATITIQHMMLTINDLLGSKLRPHHYCMPICKFDHDRQAIIDIVKSGNKKFFFGSDSAPHFRQAKEQNNANPGIFSTPVVAQLLATIFEKNQMLDKLANFTSKFGADFYNLPYNTKTITLSNESTYTIPDNFSQIVALGANSTINWNII